MSEGLAGARERLRRARLYLVVEAAAEPVLGPALRGGVDMVQLRDKHAGDDDILRAAARFRAVCDEHGALFWLNDRPDLAREAGADGIHLGQEDMPVAEAREQLGPDVLIGLSTHSPAQFDAALHSGADQLSVGPVWETPTKAGRPAAGIDYVRHAAAHGGEVPWFAIGGIDAGNVSDVVAAGARRIVVVRAIRDAGDPERAATELRASLPA
ncbi:MAG: thiamine-phosphate pyrophosphorylase [Thermoleophilaceae bacterium]|nr:thiamine-phosphate pyrophosphorylase [Thermoleophilaceae bacterium]